MRLQLVAAALGVVFMCGTSTHGHGMPIHVEVVDDQLVASNGVADSVGFAGMVFADPIEDSAFGAAPQNIQLTGFPGYDINGMQTGSNLFLEPLGLSVGQGGELATRVLWYWSATTEQVETAPNDQTLRLLSTSGFGEVTLSQWGEPPAGLRIAEPLATDLGEHRHMVYYILDDSPPAAHGVYAFFATLNSPEYNESVPLLVALNHGLSSDTFVQGAMAINQAALTPGDYNRDGTVDLRDYDVWQHSFGEQFELFGAGADGNRDGRVTAADYVIWRNARAEVPANADYSPKVVPEPGSWTVPAIACLCVAVLRRRGEIQTVGRQRLTRTDSFCTTTQHLLPGYVSATEPTTRVDDQGRQSSTQVVWEG